jgi:L-lactate dehydrogenase complex protein LldG
MNGLAREEVLERIRHALGEPRVSRSHDYEVIERAYQFSGRLDRRACVDLFAGRLRDYGAGVFRCRFTEIANTVSECLIRRDRSIIVVPCGIDMRWLPEGFRFLTDSDLDASQLDAAGGALTGCGLGIAETGSLVLHERTLHGRRAITLVPDYHLCIICEAEVVETVPEAFRLLAAKGVRAATVISGPSATSDIEMTRIVGVHGPRTLDVIVYSIDPLDF